MAGNELLEALESRAIWVDESGRGKVEVFGPEAGLFLHNLSTADITGMPIGAGTEAFFGNSRARAIAWGSIYHVLLSQGRDAYWIDLPAGQSTALLAHLDRHLISEQAEFADKTEGFSQFHLCGQGVIRLLEKWIGEPMPDLLPWQHMERTLEGKVVCHMRRRDPFGFMGFDLVFQARHREWVAELIKSDLGEEKSAANLEWARIAAGTPSWGQEITPETFISEVGRNSLAVSSTKGCYLGQEPIVMARDRGQIGKRLSRLEVAGTVPAIPTPIKHADKEAGILTSHAIHPKQGGIGLGYVRRAFWEPGTNLEFEGGKVVVLGPALPTA